MPARQWNRLQDVFGNPHGDALRGCPDRVAIEMRIARGRLGLAVTQQPADDRQPLAERERPGGDSRTGDLDSEGKTSSSWSPTRHASDSRVKGRVGRGGKSDRDRQSGHSRS